jgi:hypothetical protein
MKYNTSVELQLLVNGRPVTTYGRGGRTFVEGREGAEFSLRVRNNTASRVEAVVSVDGRSVVDGEPATPLSTGYIIPAYGAYEIPGWRMSAEACAKFIFKKPGESYAAKSGSPTADTGVIGLMAWSEKAAPTPLIIQTHYHPPCPFYTPLPFPPSPLSPWYPGPTLGVESRSANLSATSATDCVVTAYNCSAPVAESAPEFKLGTGWGDKVQDAVSYSSFTRGELLVEREIYYSDAASLRAVGVELDKPVALPATGSFPSAFKFCRPPA